MTYGYRLSWIELSAKGKTTQTYAEFLEDRYRDMCIQRRASGVSCMSYSQFIERVAIADENDYTAMRVEHQTELATQPKGLNQFLQEMGWK